MSSYSTTEICKGKKKKTKTKLLEVTATAVSAAPTSFSVLPRVIISGYFYLLNLFALLHAVFFQVTATSIKYSTLAICLAIPAKALKTEMFKITLTLHQYWRFTFVLHFIFQSNEMLYLFREQKKILTDSQPLLKWIEVSIHITFFKYLICQSAFTQLSRATLKLQIRMVS